jgi:2-keto-4-pentenoate hydratase/2-oxohepta-3-ene-1,7-dioic acid hydratase in catechol pathway
MVKMRLLSYTSLSNGKRGWGVQEGQRVRSGTALAASLDDFILMGPPALAEMATLLKGGDVVEMEIDHIGRLRNVCREER